MIVGMRSVFDHVHFCAVNTLDTPACHDFWMWGLFIVEIVGLSLVLPVFYREYQWRRGLKSYLRWLADYEKVADSEAMDRAKWRGDGVVVQGFSQSEIANRIRQVIDKRSA